MEMLTGIDLKEETATNRADQRRDTPVETFIKKPNFSLNT